MSDQTSGASDNDTAGKDATASMGTSNDSQTKRSGTSMGTSNQQPTSASVSQTNATGSSRSLEDTTTTTPTYSPAEGYASSMALSDGSKTVATNPTGTASSPISSTTSYTYETDSAPSSSSDSTIKFFHTSFNLAWMGYAATALVVLSVFVYAAHRAVEEKSEKLIQPPPSSFSGLTTLDYFLCVSTPFGVAALYAFLTNRPPKSSKRGLKLILTLCLMALTAVVGSVISWAKSGRRAKHSGSSLTEEQKAQLYIYFGVALGAVILSKLIRYHIL